jgi:uncharacterized protein YceK
MRILILSVVVSSVMGCASIKEHLSEPRNKSYYEQFSPDNVRCHTRAQMKVCRQYGIYLVCQCHAKK